MFSTMSRQLRQMRQGLAAKPEEIDPAHLLPIFVPSSFVTSGDWPGPYARLGAPEIALTWTLIQPHQTMRDVNFEMARRWESQNLDWKELARRNLNRETVNRPGLHEMRRANGELSSLAFMFEDGLGPSRLLFRGTLKQRFPSGYRVAIPEMSCGIAFASDLAGEDLAAVLNIVDHCYRKGTRPLAPGIYHPDDLLSIEEIDWRAAS